MNKKNTFILSIIMLLTVMTACGGNSSTDVNKTSESYIDEWRSFYPTRALAAGDIQAAYHFEAIDAGSIQKWIDFNKEILDQLDLAEATGLEDRIDLRLLKRQVLMEIANWETDRPHENSAALYSGLISQAMTYILARDQMDPSETMKAINSRLNGIAALCDTGMKTLKNGSPERTRRSVTMLESSAGFYETGLPGIAEKQKWLKPIDGEAFKRKTAETAVKIKMLAEHIKKNVIPDMTLPDAMGSQTYTRKLKLYTDSPLTPQKLETIALEEIERVRAMMAEEAGAYWQMKNPGKTKPADLKVLMEFALEAMEANRETNQQDFLKLFKDLIHRAETFIREKQIATLPGERTLYTALSPAHFAGAAVGGVYPSGPFNPWADTLFYLPTVPDTAPEQAKEGFYRSFNNHFNTMIITHEIYPGHYMHLKIAAKHPRMVRSLFADDLYVEGWATLCEQITLNAGWDNRATLTYLAHLRKRLENAVRAYTSVQVHCNGWNKDQLVAFAVEKGLLAPQFAANLWDRVMNSPHQLTSYFLGYRAFDRQLQEQKEQMGKKFNLKRFSDTIMNSGAVPLDLLPELFTNNKK